MVKLQIKGKSLQIITNDSCIKMYHMRLLLFSNRINHFFLNADFDVYLSLRRCMYILLI